MISEAVKLIRAMKHQFQVFEQAEKVLEELSVAAETGAAIRKETQEAEKRLAVVKEESEGVVAEAQAAIAHSCKVSQDQVVKDSLIAKKESENRQLELEYSTEAYQQYQDAIRGAIAQLEAVRQQHVRFMDKAQKEKSEIETALIALKNRLKL